MRILLLNPPYFKKFSRPQRSPAVTKSGTIYFPMWLAYATGVLEKEGHEVMLIDAPAEASTLEEVTKLTTDFEPQMMVLDTSTPSIHNDIRVAEALKRTLPDSFVVLVGTHVSALPEETLQLSNDIDAIVRGEYDYTLRDIAHYLEGARLPIDKQELTPIEGLSLMINERVIHTSPRPFIENLDEIPFVSEVYKKHLRIENYFNPNALYPTVTIITGRGCPYGCSFCVYPQTFTGRKYRFRGLENVVEEMEYIAKTFPSARSIFFEDDTLTANRKRCRELSDLIIKRGLKVNWTANARADLDLDTLEAMRAAGCHTLCVGFESGNQRILDTMRKNLKVEEMFQFMRAAKKAGILVHGCFMVGLPGETKENLRETLELAKNLNPDTAQFYPIMVYPGTEAYEWFKMRGLLTTADYSQWLTPSGLHNCVVQTDDLSPKDLVTFCDQARREFYLRPRYLLYKLSQMVRHPGMIRKTIKSGRTFFKYLVKGSDLRI